MPAPDDDDDDAPPPPPQVRLKASPPPPGFGFTSGLAFDEEPPPPRNFKEFLDAKFGAALTDTFMAPYNAKVWAHPAHEMNHIWVGERVSAIKTSSVLSNVINRKDAPKWGPNAQFRYPMNGTGHIWVKIFSELPKERKTLGAWVKAVRTKPRGGLKQRLGDSKGLVSHGNIALAEAWTRVLVERGHGKHRDAATPDELLDAVTLDSRVALTEPCPKHVTGQCWETEGEDFTAPEEMGDTMKLLRKDLDRLHKRGVEIVAVRSVVVCTHRLNQAVAEGKSRFVVDLHAMERLILAFRDLAGEEIEAECGKVAASGSTARCSGRSADACTR